MNKSVPSQSIDPVNTGEAPKPQYRDAEVCYKGLEPAYVEQSLLTSNADDSFLIKLLMRQTRRPEIGDKLSSRHGQKGVIGTIVSDIFVPCTGITVITHEVVHSVLIWFERLFVAAIRNAADNTI